MKIEAVSRLTAAPMPAFTNSVIKTLEDEGLKITRQNDRVFTTTADIKALVSALSPKGWRYSSVQKKLSRAGESYSLSVAFSGTLTRLSFVLER